MALCPILCGFLAVLNGAVSFTPSSSLLTHRPVRVCMDSHGPSRRLLLDPTVVSPWSCVRSGVSSVVAFSTTSDSTDSSDNDNENDEKDSLDLNEAEALRRRAKQLKAEAKAEEVALKESRSKQRKERVSESDAMINHLFAENATTTTVTDRLRRERWSKEQLVLVVERLHEQQKLASGRSSSPILVSNDFQIGNVANSAIVNETEWQLVDGYIQSLVSAADTLDEEYRNRKQDRDHSRWPGRVGPALKTRLKELRRVDEESFKRRLAAEVNAAMRGSSNSSIDSTMMGYMRRTLGQPESSTEKNVTRLMERIAAVPMWVPSSILPFVITATTRLDSSDVKRIKDDVLAGTEFYCTSCESIPIAAIFRGNVRTAAGLVNSTTDENQTAILFEKIQSRLVQHDMDERVQLFFMKDPEWRPNRDPREQEPRPVVLAIPKAVVPEQAKERGRAAKIIAGLSVVCTLFATLAFSISCFALNPDFFESIVNQNDYTVLTACVPMILGVIALQAIHEAAHYVAAKRSRIDIGLPIPIPSLQIGTFGSITPLRSFPYNRPALFDFAVSGPMAQMVSSILLMIAGVLVTVYSSRDALSHFPVVPTALFKSSFLTGSILTVFAPKLMLLPLSQPVPIHPIFMTGFAGLISSALNFLPVGRLDGGRACTAVFGSRFNTLTSLLTLLLLVVLALTGGSNIAIFWGAFVVLCQRQQEIPVRNEVTDLDSTRVGAYAVSLTMAVLALSPAPGGPGFL